MEVAKFIDENRKLKYEDIKLKLEKNYNLEIRLDKNNNYYMISTTNESNFKNPLIRQCTGIILEKSTNKILHYFGEMSYDIDNKYNNNIIDLKNVNIKNCYITKYINGKIIKVFNYNNEWKFATSKHTDIKRFKIGNEILYKCFKNVILKMFNSINDFLYSLDNNYCYTFILSNDNIYMINKVNLNTLKEEFNFNKYFHLSKYKYDNRTEENEKLIIIEKNKIHENQIINKIHVSIKDLKELLYKNIYRDNKSFNKSCELIHIVRSDINNNHKRYGLVLNELSEI